MSADTTDQDLKVTIKYHAGYEAAWAVFAGPREQVRQDLEVFVGSNCDGVSDLPLVDLIAYASLRAQQAKPGTITPPVSAQSVVEQTLGGELIAETASNSTPENDAWAGIDNAAQASPPAEETDPVLAAIKGAMTKRQLQQAFAAHKDAITSDEAYTAALKKRNEQLAD